MSCDEVAQIHEHLGEVLGKYVFHNSNPAIFGVKILAGKAVANSRLIDETGEEKSRIKAIQSENKSVAEAKAGMEVAVSLPGTAFDRQLKNSKFLYSDMTSEQFKKFKENKELLSREEIKILQEIAEIKRRKKFSWGI